MNRLNDLDGATSQLEAAFDAIRGGYSALAQRVIAAEAERDAERAKNAATADDLSRYDNLVDRLLEIARKYTSVSQQG